MRGRVALRAARMSILRLSPPCTQGPRFRCSNRSSVALFCSAANPNRKKDKVIVISGPTGAGKSRLALELAKRLNGEIISADSVQVYRGLDIGSAKPTVADRKEVLHYLIDILHPSEEYSAGQFYEDARKATREILEKQHVPIVAGGTGLYLRWYIYGKPDVPKASMDVSSEIWSELAHLQQSSKWDEAVELVVKAGDPKARLVCQNDWYRLRRSLEIIRSSGAPPSAFAVPYDAFREQLRLPEDSLNTNVHVEHLAKELDYEFLCFFLSSPRVDLYRSIDLRCEEMLMETDGLLSEASWLLDVRLHPNMNSATRAIGYRQAMEYLLSCREAGGGSCAESFYAFLADFQKTSRNFAKRQMTWFRNEMIYQWLDASQPLDRVVEFVCSAYNGEDDKAVEVPEPLRMNKDVNGREYYKLKSYRVQNKLFTRVGDCYHIVDWIRKTQFQSVRAN